MLVLASFEFLRGNLLGKELEKEFLIWCRERHESVVLTPFDRNSHENLWFRSYHKFTTLTAVAGTVRRPALEFVRENLRFDRTGILRI